MASKIEIAKQWVAAQQSRDADQIKALGEQIADDAVFQTRRGDISGKQAILERLQNPPQGPGGGGGGGMLSQIKWGEPEESGGVIKVVATLPEGLPIPIKGLELSLEFNAAGKVQKAQMQPQM